MQTRRRSYIDIKDKSMVRPDYLARFVKQFSKRKLWHLQQNKLTINELIKIFSHFGTLYIQMLDLGWNEDRLVKDICLEVKFPNLKKLNIANNSIASAEKLQLLDCPCLQELTMYRNQITFLRSFRKNIFPNLKRLDLTKNKLVSMQHFEEFNSKNLKQFFLKSKKAEDQACFNQCNQMDWIFKIDSRRMYEIEINIKGYTNKIDRRIFQRMFQSSFFLLR